MKKVEKDKDMALFGFEIDENIIRFKDDVIEEKMKEISKAKLELGEKISKLQKCEKENELLNGKANELRIEVSKLLYENESLKRKIRKLKRKIRKNDLDCRN